jgi:hypothetical protein
MCHCSVCDDPAHPYEALPDECSFKQHVQAWVLSKLLFLLQSLLYPITDSGADGNTYFDEEKHEQKRAEQG